VFSGPLRGSPAEAAMIFLRRASVDEAADAWGFSTLERSLLQLPSEEATWTGNEQRCSRCHQTHLRSLRIAGRKSGRPFELPSGFLVDADTVYLTTMNMKRHWPKRTGQSRRRDSNRP